MPHVSTAKITRPALKGVAARPRLFAQLDRIMRRHAIAWVSAPAGSGKTTLAASWLAARKRPCLWYQLDAGDADPATFFYYQRESVGRLAPRRRETLPLLTPEYALGLAAYARHFFELLPSRVPRGTVIVLDNFHDLPEDAPLQEVLPQALSVLPAGVRVIVLSRSAPPPALARLVVEGALGFLEADELSLSAAETRALARSRLGRTIGAADADTVRRQTHGWVAGTVLLLEGTTRALPPPQSARTSTEQVLFDYFASEIFERAPPETRRLLLATALLPEVSVAAAESLAGEPRAADILADLVRRNYFTHRLAGSAPLYRFHPLFRSFLLARARASFSDEVLARLRTAAAEKLEEMGRWEDAATLLVEASDWAALEKLVLAHAPELLRQGRSRTLEGWLRAMPMELLGGSPWLSYWLGAATLAVDVAESRARFEAAFRLFTERDEIAGSYLSWCGILDTYMYVWGEFASVDHWISEAEALREKHPKFPSPEIEARFTLGMFSALMYRNASSPEIRFWEERARAMALESGDAALRTATASQLITYHVWWTGDLSRLAPVVSAMRDLVRSARLAPFLELAWHSAESAYCVFTAAHSRCSALVEQGLRVAESTGAGVRLVDFPLALMGTWNALSTADLASAAEYLERMAPVVNTRRSAEAALYRICLGWKALYEGDFRLALQEAETSLELMHRARLPLGVAVCHLLMAEPLIEQGEYGAARSWLEKGYRLGTEVRAASAEYLYWLLDALWALRSGDSERAVRSIREHLRVLKQTGIVNRLFWRDSVMAELYAKALEAGNETDLVKSIIRKRKLAPPDGCDLESWPWPVRIHVLGRSELWRDGERVSFSGKVPRKPLELLQALATLGGEDVHEDVLADFLWPDSDGDAAAHALDTTVHRLRKLLGDPAAIVFRDRRLSLERRLCWVDALALSRRLTRALERLEREPVDTSDVRREAERILDLYRGPLVASGPERRDAAETARGRLRSQLCRFLQKAAGHLARAGDSPLAAKYLARAREADPSLESATRFALVG